MESGWRRNYLRYKSFFLNMMTQYRDKADWRVYLEILLSLATVSIFSIFALRPTILTIAELIKQIEEKKATVKLMDDKIQNIGKAQILFDRESRTISNLFNYAVPNKPKPDIFARQIEALSSKHQVSVETITLGDGILKGAINNSVEESAEAGGSAEEKPLHDHVDFTITAVASVDQFESIAGFAKDFENLMLTPNLNIVDLSIKEDDVSNKTLILLIEGELPYINSEIDQIISI